MRRGTLLTAGLWVGTFAVLLHAEHAGAAEPTKGELTAARALFAEGEADEDAGRWADALVKIRRASSVKMTPGLRFHLALCEEKLGQLVPALDDYSAAQAAAQRENNREVLDQVTQPLAALRARVPTLTLNVPPSLVGARGVEILVDGAAFPSGLWGTPVPEEVGSHTVQARAPGKAPFATTVTLVPRQAVAVDVRLTPVAPGLPPPLPAGPIVSTPLPPTAMPPMEAPSRTSSHAFAIAATAGAAVLVGVGVGAFAVAGGDASSSAAQCRTTPTVLPCGAQTAVRTWDAVALATWIGGAAATVGAIVLWTHPQLDARSSETRGALELGPGSVSLRGTF